jgi:antitoxin Phd
MSEVWQLQEAKSKFSEVVEDALRDGPQVITRRGVKTAVLLSYTDYQQMFLKQQKISDFFRQSPLVGVDLDLSRDQSPIRDDLNL